MMVMSSCVLAGVLLVAQPGTGSAADSSDYKLLERCVVSLIDHVELPAQEAGVLAELNAKEGMLVKEGDVLGKVDDKQTLVKKKAAEFRLAVAHEKATNDANVRVAKKIIELYEAEYAEAKAINDRVKNAISEKELRRQFVQWEKATLDAVAADMEFKILGLEKSVVEAELEATEQELERRLLIAPFDGVVETLFKFQSEWVQPGDPVLFIQRMDKLRIVGFLNVDEYAPRRVQGARVQIIADLEGDRLENFEGQIDGLSSSVEANGDYRIWAEVENRTTAGGTNWMLRPGAEVEMRIYVAPSGVASVSQ